MVPLLQENLLVPSGYNSEVQKTDKETNYKGTSCPCLWPNKKRSPLILPLFVKLSLVVLLFLVFVLLLPLKVLIISRAF